ncbi:hypothetical protein FisN_8Lh100 [Fistulifera solaris]|uniref:Uncharacterized protein n=1 Tax=Fistulifera solaris TaxID=1519565 RepID=A0A1Z5JDD8_FISSO|nr:hypothetical protein FisN_8Lh100 [Fistulifera solaris]|eukprot:GAX12005.1 hypothetical protein FisN_8Lh100 [Fistulifera solaris]
MRLYGLFTVISSASAFTAYPVGRPSSALQSTIVTGPGGKPASSADEDLRLTLQIIMDHESRSATVSKEQFISQMKEAEQVAHEVVDVSIPYDAAAKLAYEASDKSMKYADFKVKYEENAVLEVKAKRPVDLSIPYDAAARLAYEASDKSMNFADYKFQYEEKAVAEVKAKQPAAAKHVAKAGEATSSVDLSIPYDAAAKLAYEKTDKSMNFSAYQKTYYDETVAMVSSKKAVDLSIPYDAAAQLAFMKSDRTTPFADFKEQYVAQAVAEVKAKSS